MKFHLTKYRDDNDGKYYAESWVQINMFGKCFCLFRRKIEIYPKLSETLFIPVKPTADVK